VAAGKQREKAWSLAAAARAAREARISAVRYMREAAIEREWQAAALSYGHQARAAHSDNPDGARALLFATMGYRPPYPDGWDQASAMMLADEAQYLAGADLYVLTPQMLDVVIAAAQSLTFADLALLWDDDLPSPSGTVILPRPLITRHPSGSLLQETAFTWRSPSQVPLPSGMGFSRAELPAVRMSGYTTPARPSRGFMHAARAQRVALPPMLLEVVWSLPLHPGTPRPGTRFRPPRRRAAGAQRRVLAGRGTQRGSREAGTGDRRVRLGRHRGPGRRRHDRLPVPVRVLAAMRAANRRHPGRPGQPQCPGDRHPRRSEPRRAGCRAAPRRVRTSGITTGWCGCTRSASGIPACSSTK
jgi:hypothetical protein